MSSVYVKRSRSPLKGTPRSTSCTSTAPRYGRHPDDARNDRRCAGARSRRDDGGVSLCGRDDRDSIRYRPRPLSKRIRTIDLLTSNGRLPASARIRAFERYREIGGPMVVAFEARSRWPLPRSPVPSRSSGDAYWQNGIGHPRSAGPFPERARLLCTRRALDLVDAGDPPNDSHVGRSDSRRA